jgi:hypothetical protein
LVYTANATGETTIFEVENVGGFCEKKVQSNNFSPLHATFDLMFFMIFRELHERLFLSLSTFSKIVVFRVCFLKL